MTKVTKGPLQGGDEVQSSKDRTRLQQSSDKCGLCMPLFGSVSGSSEIYIVPDF